MLCPALQGGQTRIEQGMKGIHAARGYAGLRGEFVGLPVPATDDNHIAVVDGHLCGNVDMAAVPIQPMDVLAGSIVSEYKTLSCHGVISQEKVAGKTFVIKIAFSPVWKL